MLRIERVKASSGSTRTRSVSAPFALAAHAPYGALFMRDFQPGDDVFMQHPHLVAEGSQITMELLTDTMELLTGHRKALAHLGLELQNLRRQNVQSLRRSFHVGHPLL